MKLVSVTLAGNAEGIILPALQSVVDIVDACLIVDTGITDGTLEMARQVAREKLVVREFSWVNDFALARNFSLDAAEKEGADWAVIIDTDERIEANGDDLRALLAGTSAGLLLMPDREKNYTKERAVKLPSPSRYVGPTHESFAPPPAGTVVAPHARFYELPKSAAASRLKFERDAAILEEHAQKHPDQPRWLYYLGESLKNLRRFDEAIEAYRACADLRGWNEESAWACFRAAQCYEEQKEYAAMVDVLTKGMARHAGLAELMWYAGFAYLEMGQPAQAVYWSRLSLAWGLHVGRGREVPRIGFRHLPGLWEGPYDVLRFALRALGDEAGAAAAERDYEEAKRARMSETE